MTAHSRLRWAPHAVIILSCALAVAGCGTGSSARGPSAYVAMGDSYSSGAGIAPLDESACSRSTKNFAAQVAERLHESSFTDVSCGGATTSDLTDLQASTGNPPQLEALGRRTRLVTLTIGLNDQNVSYGLLFACQSASGTPSTACQQLLRLPPGAVDTAIAAATSRVAQALRLVRKRAPEATVVLVGYPRILPETGDCPDRLPLVPAIEPLVREVLEKVDDGWRRAARQAGARYVDTWTMSEGHDVCSSDPWVNGATEVEGKAAALHPFESYHQAVADAVVKLVEKQ